jgi:tripartite-type tricarboxylate transporter receptor subunit TctC
MPLTRRQMLAALAASSWSAAALAAPWPTKPVRWIVAFAPGGATDVMSRVAAERLQAGLGQAVVVDNVSGAAGVIGTDRLRRAAPDGYTVGTIPNSLLTMSPYVSEQPVPYDPMNDFTPISGLATFQYSIEVLATSKIRTLADLIEIGRKEPGKLTFGTTGVGTGSQLATVLLTQKTGAKFTDVPYKGGSEYTNALLSGTVDFICDPIGGSLGLLKEGKVRSLATTGARRSALLPEIAPVAETIPGYDHQGWFGLYGPAGLPADVVDRLHAEVAKFQQTDAFVSSILKLSYENMQATPAELKARAQAEYDQWGAILKKPRA